jgi:hypothetical protein
MSTRAASEASVLSSVEEILAELEDLADDTHPLPGNGDLAGFAAADEPADAAEEAVAEARRACLRVRAPQHR